MTVGSLFAGIGGFDLAARWMDWSTSWYSEIEPYACRVMEKNFPGVPNLGDIRKITDPLPVDILCGGFPCQDISLAGKGAGIEGKRSGLWTEYARLIAEVRPQYVVAENVRALRTRGLDTVLQSLDEIGYDAEWHCIPASSVGAPHQRDRIWIIGYAGGAPYMGDTLRSGLERYSGDEGPTQRETPPGSPPEAGIRRGAHSARWWLSEPNVDRVAHGIPSRVDRLRGLGNALVPPIPYIIFQAINRHAQVYAAVARQSAQRTDRPLR